MKNVVKTILSHILPIHYRYRTSEPVIYLTFDDGPTTQTPKILELLNRYSIQATFFILGKRIANNEDILVNIAAKKHSIGNHTFYHKNAKDLTYSELISDLNACSSTIKSILPTWAPGLMRPPFGSLSIYFIYNAIKQKEQIIMWSKDSIDYRGDSGKTIQNNLGTLENGDIVLFHDEYPATLEALEELIPYYLAQGYSFLPL